MMTFIPIKLVVICVKELELPRLKHKQLSFGHEREFDISDFYKSI
jgi:hypothetical protein